MLVHVYSWEAYFCLLVFRQGNSSLNGTAVYPLGIRVHRNVTENESPEEVVITLPDQESSAVSSYTDILGIVFTLTVVSGLLSQENRLFDLLINCSKI